MDLVTIVNQTAEAYMTLQETHPIAGAVLSAGVMFPAGDAVSQLVVDKRVDWKKIRYTAFLSPSYGLSVHGLMVTGDLVGEHVMDHPLAKSALGPNLFGHLLNAFLFVNNTVGERTGYNPYQLLCHYAGIFKPSRQKSFSRRVKERIVDSIPGREYLNAAILTLTAWNGFQYCNYSYVPEEMRTPAAIGAGFIGTSLLSLWSLKGRRKIVQAEQELPH